MGPAFNTMRPKPGPGASAARGWLNDDADHQRARELIDEFQTRWVEQARSQGERPSMRWSMLPLLAGFVGLLTWAFWSLLKSLGS